jgi:hypothetical protein
MRHESHRVSRGRPTGLVVGIVAFAAYGAAMRSAEALQIVGAPAAQFWNLQTYPDLNEVDLTIFLSGSSSPPGVAVPVTLTFSDLVGGGPSVYSTTLPSDGHLVLSSYQLSTTGHPTVPFTDFLFGHQVTVAASGEPSMPPLAWYKGTFTWVDAQVVVSGAPVALTPSTFTVSGNPSIRVDSPFGSRVLSVVGSEIDVTYTHSVDLFDCVINGSSSYLRLSDGTQIGFYDQQHFYSGSPNFNGYIGFDGIGLASRRRGPGARLGASASREAASPLPWRGT